MPNRMTQIVYYIRAVGRVRNLLDRSGETEAFRAVGRSMPELFPEGLTAGRRGGGRGCGGPFP
ncbi:hypothetical protein GCM10010439_09550 [Actinocorallia aurantiaca]|uniref:Uncharacterized protein n=1 Tax=Actinocorallia aurantiaca TaxID=46204 RepID=A0ABN3TYB9_9ACTN